MLLLDSYVHVGGGGVGGMMVINTTTGCVAKAAVVCSVGTFVIRVVISF